MAHSDRNTILFAGLVTMFHAAGMQHLGKIKNPLTDKIERNLEQAQFVIDMLDMLAQKTKGHLTEEENRLLMSASQELKLNYVDEVSKDQASGKGQP